MNLLSRLIAPAAVVCLVAAAPRAQAQLLDEVEWRRDGADAVLQLRFVTEVQLRRSAVGRSGDFTQAFYVVLPTRQTLDPLTTERRVRATATAADRPGLPAVSVTDEVNLGGAPDERRLLIRFDRAAEHRVRAGRGNRTIELVLPGRGEAVPPDGGATAAPGGGWRVTLQSGQPDGAFLSTPIPASLQQEPVYTTRRMVDGRAVHDTHLGRFASRAAAEAALARLAGRFPAARVSHADEDARTAPPAAAPAASAAATAAAAPAVPADAAPPAPAEIGTLAAALLSEAKAALARGEPAAAVEALSRLLDLPPNAVSAEAQALAGDARRAAGDLPRARSEYELYLKLHPEGPETARVRAALAELPAAGTPARTRRVVEPTTTLTGSVSTHYYGGQSKIRSQEFQDSPLNGLPELVSDAKLSAADQRQVIANADVNWRHRDADGEQRFVFRNTYIKDLLRSDKTRNRLTQLYYDQRSFVNGTSFRIGRQSPLGGGVLGRFDGVTAGYAFRPRWKAGIVAGQPVDTLLDTKRWFYGASIDAEALTPQLGGSAYLIEQRIDHEVDRRAIGADLRWFDGGGSATGQIDYDLTLKAINIASLQGTWMREDNTVVNVLVDRRKQPLLMLGNALFFTDPNLTVRPTRLADLLATRSLDALREQVQATTALSTQAAVSVTTPLSPKWQVGVDLRYANTGAILPVPDILPTGLPSTGDIWTVGAQAIGINLYSARDTHVFIVNAIHGPTFKGQMISYNNASQVAERWQLEPSLRLYLQSDNSGTRSTRWTPGLRVSFRATDRATLESELSVEQSKVDGPMRHESSSRVFYFLGGRYDF